MREIENDVFIYLSIIGIITGLGSLIVSSCHIIIALNKIAVHLEQIVKIAGQ